MRLDMLLYGLDNYETINIDGVQYDLIATGNDRDMDEVSIIYAPGNGQYYLYSVMGLLFESADLRGLFETIADEGRHISWDERRFEADALIDEFATSTNTDDLYAEAILDLEADGEDVSEMREAFEEEFGYSPEDAL